MCVRTSVVHHQAMTTPHQKFRNIPRWALAAGALTSLLVAAEPSELAGAAAPDSTTITVRVTDDSGNRLSDAVVMACPIRDGGSDCSRMITAATNVGAVTRLTLDSGTAYDIVAFVSNPAPAWPCPGFQFAGNELYISANRLTGLPTSMQPPLTLRITRQQAYDCIPVAIIDGQGHPLDGGLIICPAAQGPGCGSPTFDGPDADGIVRVDTDPGVSYSITAYISDSGWPCPHYAAPSGSTFHFSEPLTVDSNTLPGTDFVIIEPDAADCS
jgi:hypothetical protein